MGIIEKSTITITVYIDPSIIGRFNIMRVCGEFIRMDRCMHHTTPKSRRTASDELFAVYAVRRK